MSANCCQTVRSDTPARSATRGAVGRGSPSACSARIASMIARRERCDRAARPSAGSLWLTRWPWPPGCSACCTVDMTSIQFHLGGEHSSWVPSRPAGAGDVTAEPGPGKLSASVVIVSQNPGTSAGVPLSLPRALGGTAADQEDGRGNEEERCGEEPGALG